MYNFGDIPQAMAAQNIGPTQMNIQQVPLATQAETINVTRACR